MSFQGPTQVGESGDKKEQLKKEITIIKKQMNLPIGSNFPIPNSQMEKGLVSGNSIQELEIFKKSPLQGVLQEKSSIEEWQGHFNYSNYLSTEKNSSDSWHNYKTDTCSNINNYTVKKLPVNRKPLKHKNLLKKNKLMCLQGKSKTKCIKETLKKDNSNLLQKSKLYGHQDKSKANSTDWFRSIQCSQEENSDWFKTADISVGFEAMIIDCKQFPETEQFYDMKDLTNECENIQKEEQEIRNPRIVAYDFQNLIKECENLKNPYESMYQSSNEVDELAGYLDNMLQIPKEMSAMAKAMYT